MLLPLADYERIFLTVKAILDAEDAMTAHACQFFALMGAAILFTHYGVRAKPAFGAAFLLLDEETKDILSYGRVEGNTISSDDKRYHAWLDTGDYVIDFMAPLYGEAMRAKGYTKVVPRLVLQHSKSSLAPSIFDLKKRGDCFLAPNNALSQYMVSYYLGERQHRDMIETAVRWYRKPPEPMDVVQTTGRKGVAHTLALGQSIIDGIW
ncbi:DUF2026 family protein [Duganella vulcania]|uniref:DUF2026 domain-containing protein n=1 Tax=Duganella vulcania TaxID=2692166 RepID=A0A845GNB5_9BURK|nr:DUF2026 family protein [Duganella vulcania]MYM94129.1 DUF2026 domain-containing protein [Duganella vulcania]